MPGTSYRPGSWFGVVRGSTVVLLAPDTATELVHSIWSALEQAPEAHEVLHEVTDGFGVSLSRIPPFGIIDAGSSLRVFLRGELELAVTSGRGSETVHGRDVTTWTERRFEAPESYRLEISPDGSAGRPAHPAVVRHDGWLPLTDGVVMLSGLNVSLVARPVSNETVTDFEPLDLELTILPSQLNETGSEAESEEEPTTAAAPSAAGVPTAAAVRDAQGQPLADELLVAEHADSVGREAAYRDTAHQDTADQDTADQDTEEIRADDVQTEEVNAEEPRAGLVQASELTSNYDHLWEKTVMRNIEDAAVRLDPEADAEADASPSSSPAAGSTPVPAGGKQPAPGQDAAGQPSAVRSSDHAPAEQEVAVDSDQQAAAGVRPPRGTEPGIEPGPGQSPAPGPWMPPSLLPSGNLPGGNHPSGNPSGGSGSGLIDSVPWASSRSEAKPPVIPQQPAAPPVRQGTHQPPAQERARQLPADLPVKPGDDDADHDGQTVMKDSLASLAGDAGGEAVRVPAATRGNGPTVLARVCGKGHANPPTYAQCATCGMALPGDAVQVPRPSLGKVRLSTGDVIELDQSLIIGRQPSVSRVQGGSMPRLVQVASPGGDISRSHVEVRLEGWHVMLCDLKATNGTLLIREGQPPRRLAQSEMAILLDGDIAELGEGISLRFEEIL